MHPEVRVWRARLELDGRRLAEARSHLSPAERAREARFARPEARDRFAAARGQLRELLAARLGLEPKAVPIVAGPNQKPQLDPRGGLDDIRFNLSHSGTASLIALAEGREVGVDVELRDPGRRFEALAPRFMSPRELETWRQATGDEREAAFFATWTRKEAYAKGLGEGLGMRLAELELEPAGGGARRWRARRGGRLASAWLIADVEVWRGYCGAVAVEAEDASIRQLELRTDVSAVRRAGRG